ncbi:hypothetical protein [Maricaulis sp.]|uniref:hypothetical protein n=1 Tax=Maricaulis sp. TaxID=1486257 RepID=UPI003A90BF74
MASFALTILLALGLDGGAVAQDAVDLPVFPLPSFTARHDVYRLCDESSECTFSVFVEQENGELAELHYRGTDQRAPDTIRVFHRLSDAQGAWREATTLERGEEARLFLDIGHCLTMPRRNLLTCGVPEERQGDAHLTDGPDGSVLSLCTSGTLQTQFSYDPDGILRQVYWANEQRSADDLDCDQVAPTTRAFVLDSGTSLDRPLLPGPLVEPSSAFDPN